MTMVEANLLSLFKKKTPLYFDELPLDGLEFDKVRYFSNVRKISYLIRLMLFLAIFLEVEIDNDLLVKG